MLIFVTWRCDFSFTWSFSPSIMTSIALSCWFLKQRSGMDSGVGHSVWEIQVRFQACPRCMGALWHSQSRTNHMTWNTAGINLWIYPHSLWKNPNRLLIYMYIGIPQVQIFKFCDVHLPLHLLIRPKKSMCFYGPPTDPSFSPTLDFFSMWPQTHVFFWGGGGHNLQW